MTDPRDPHPGQTPTETPAGDPSAGDRSTGDPRAGAPRPSQTGSVQAVGFDDPELRPLPPDKLDYHIPHPDAHPEWHEHSDVPIRPLALALGMIAALCVGSAVLLYFVFWRYDAQQEAMEYRIQRTAVPRAKPPVPEPRLEGLPGFSVDPRAQDVAEVRKQYQEELSRWAPAPEQGFARVPVDRAMDLAIERGMFKTTAPAGAAQTRPAQGKAR